MSSVLHDFELWPFDSIADHGIEAGQQLPSKGDDDDLVWLSCSAQPVAAARVGMRSRPVVRRASGPWRSRSFSDPSPSLAFPCHQIATAMAISIFDIIKIGVGPDGHLAVLEACRHTEGFEHLVYASSSSVYGGNTKLPFSVEDPTDTPVSLYAATKKADELMSETYANLYRLPQTGLRFFTVYGPWGRPDMAMWLFTQAIFEGRPIDVFGQGNMRRDFTYIDDIVTGVVAALDNPPPDDGAGKAGGSKGPHRLYNIGNHRSEELTRMIGLIEAACGRKAEKRLLPMQPGDVRDTYADIGAITRDLGFEPTTAIDEGVPRFVAWYREYRGR